VPSLSTRSFKADSSLSLWGENPLMKVLPAILIEALDSASLEDKVSVLVRWLRVEAVN